MRKTCVSSTLAVYFDGQFWVGMAERVEDGCLSACRVVFGAEPSNEEVLTFVLERWTTLPFSDPVALEDESVRRMAGNPKRRQREAARELRQREASTKAQQALAEQYEAAAKQRKREAKACREQGRADAFERRKLKAKRRHRGK